MRFSEEVYNSLFKKDEIKPTIKVDNETMVMPSEEEEIEHGEEEIAEKE